MQECHFDRNRIEERRERRDVRGRNQFVYGGIVGQARIDADKNRRTGGTKRNRRTLDDHAGYDGGHRRESEADQ